MAITVQFNPIDRVPEKTKTLNVVVNNSRRAHNYETKVISFCGTRQTNQNIIRTTSLTRVREVLNGTKLVSKSYIGMTIRQVSLLDEFTNS